MTYLIWRKASAVCVLNERALLFREQMVATEEGEWTGWGMRCVGRPQP